VIAIRDQSFTVGRLPHGVVGLYVLIADDAHTLAKHLPTP